MSESEHKNQLKEETSSLDENVNRDSKSETNLNEVKVLKRKGDELFIEKKYEDAIDFYTRALELDPNDPNIYADRANSYIELSFLYRGLADCNKALEIDNGHIKGIFRKVKSMVRIGKYEEAVEFIDKVRDLKNESIEEYYDFQNKMKELEFLAKFLSIQKQFGNFDYLSMIKAAETKAVASFEGIAVEYIAHDFIKISENENKGRGLVATEKIESGKLLIASKAFTCIYPRLSNIVKECEKEDVDLNADKGELISKITRERLIQHIANLIKMEPERGKELYKLNAGSTLGYLEAEKGDECEILDIDRIRGIVNQNMLTALKQRQNDLHVHIGIWIFPSLINNDCFDRNCSWIVVGDYIFIRALRQIEPGEEILISYLNPTEYSGAQSRRTVLLNGFGFKCQCRLCEKEEKEPETLKKKRKNALEKFYSFENEIGPEESLKAFENLIGEMLVKELDELCLYFILPFKELCGKFLEKEKEKKALECLERSYELMKKINFYDERISYELVFNIKRFYEIQNTKYDKGLDDEKLQTWKKIFTEETVRRFGSPYIVPNKLEYNPVEHTEQIDN